MTTEINKYDIGERHNLPDAFQNYVLDPCPVCGAKYSIPSQRLGPTRLMFTDRNYRVICLACWHKGRKARSLKGAIDNWNNGMGASKLKEYRLKAGLSQLELAGMCGLGYTAISGYELGKRVPSQQNKVLIAQALGIEPELL